MKTLTKEKLINYACDVLGYSEDDFNGSLAEIKLTFTPEQILDAMLY